NGIVPKNLRKLLQKIDPESPKPQQVSKLTTPTQGEKGHGFTLFPLSDSIKSEVTGEGRGQPLFALGGERGAENLADAEEPEKAAGAPQGGGSGQPPSAPPPSTPAAGGFERTPDGPIGRRLHNIIEKYGLGDAIRDIQMKVTPMAVRDATIQSRAAAK